MPTRYELHIAKWSNCTRCTLQHTRRNVVIGKGDIGKTDVVVVGEAPGHSEDSLAKPFAGPAGRILDPIIESATFGRKLRIAYTNIVCCIPLNADGDKVTAPEAVEATSCGPRLREFLEICKPKMIVACGDVPKKWLPRVVPDLIPKPPGYVEIIHPAAMFHMPFVQKSFAVQRCVVQLKSAFNEVFGPIKES